MNEGGFLSPCDCPCGCLEYSYSRWCFDCQVFHARRITIQVRNEKELLL